MTLPRSYEPKISVGAGGFVGMGAPPGWLTDVVKLFVYHQLRYLLFQVTFTRLFFMSNKAPNVGLFYDNPRELGLCTSSTP